MGSDRFSQRYRKLSKGLCEVVQDYGLLSFIPLAIQDKSSVQHLLGYVDKANGYVFASLATKSPYPPEFLYGASSVSDRDLWTEMQDKYVDRVTEREGGEEARSPPSDGAPASKPLS